MNSLLPPGTDNESLKIIAKNTGRPEYKTWSFWLAIIGIIIGIIAIIK